MDEYSHRFSDGRLHRMCRGRCDWSEIMYNVWILSSSKRNIYHVEVAIEDVDDKGSFGESSAVAATS